MATRREQIILAVIAKLATLISLPAGRVFRSRETAITRGEAPCVVVQKKSEPPPENRNVAEMRLGFVIEVYTRGENGEADADPIENEIHALLMADRTLGDTCLLLDANGTDWEGADADQPAHITLMGFSAMYRVEPENLSEPA
jgi:hypothetical protein